MHLPRLHKPNRLTLELRKVSITNGDGKAALKKRAHLIEAHTARNWTNTIFYGTLNRILVSCLLFSSLLFPCLIVPHCMTNLWSAYPETRLCVMHELNMTNSDLKTAILKTAHIKWYSPTL